MPPNNAQRRAVAALGAWLVASPTNAHAQNASVPLAQGDRGHIALDVQVIDGNSIALGGAGVSLKHERNSAGLYLGEAGDVTVKAERRGEQADVAGRLTQSPTSRTLGFELKLPFDLFAGGVRDRPLAEPPPIAVPVEPPPRLPPPAVPPDP